MIYKGDARKLDDYDLPRIGKEIGVGEDILHVFIDVETSGGRGYDNQGRVIMLFEPHKFFRHLKGAKLKQAVKVGLAYPSWGMEPYPRDSYPRLEEAMKIDETAALKSASWGMGQIMGENYADVGYTSVQEMVEAFANNQASQLQAMVEFIKTNGLDDDLRALERMAESGKLPTAADWAPIVRIYNGPGFAHNRYHIKAAVAYAKWLKIPDTPLPEVPAPPVPDPTVPVYTEPPGTIVLPKVSPSMKTFIIGYIQQAVGFLAMIGVTVVEFLGYLKANPGVAAIFVVAGLVLVGYGLWYIKKGLDRSATQTLENQAIMANKSLNNVIVR
jgi:hypothetical protein